MSVTIVTKNNFEQEVLKQEKPILLDFFASWCGPCKQLAPIIEEIADEHPELKVCKIDVEAQQELSEHYRVRGVPSLLVVKDGEVVNRSVGMKAKQQILDMIR